MPRKKTKKATGKAYRVKRAFSAPGFTGKQGDIIPAEKFPKGVDWPEVFCEPVEGYVPDHTTDTEPVDPDGTDGGGGEPTDPPAPAPEA